MKRPGFLLAVMLMMPRTSAAQTPARTPDESRIFVDVNFSGVATSVAQAREYESLFLVFGEVGEKHGLYPKPSRAYPFVDLGGGVMLARRFGLGVSYNRTTYEDVVGLAATIPHPTFVNAPASDTGQTGNALKRTEAAAHIFVAWVPVRTNRAELRFFGGPSFFAYTENMVQDVLYTQTYDPLTPLSTITITGAATEETRGDGLGFHVGGDFAYFFTNMFGVAGGVRFSEGTITLDTEPLSKRSQDIRVGSTVVFVGVRVRFGG